MSYETIRVERAREGVDVLTLARPQRLNALTWAGVEEIRAALATIAADATCRVVILTGEGRGFCAGLDISVDDPVGTGSSVQDVYAKQERIAGIPIALRAMPQPVIAAVNGPAAGAGLAFALAADVRIATPAAFFVAAFVRIGLSGGDIGTSYFLPRIVGHGQASEILLTGRRVPADEALRIGLVNRVVPQDELLESAFSLAAEITRNSPFGVQMTKQVVQRNTDANSLEAALELENRTQVLTTRTNDLPEALAAFLEDRPPNYTNT